MKLLLENWREYLKEQETIAVGQCYPFAVEMSNNSSESEFANLLKFKVVHGRITDKFSGESFLHAWVEKGGMVFDSQTSRTKPNGISKAEYYDIYQPEPHEEYTAEQTILKCMKTGHKGPWNHINEITTLEPEVKQGFRKAIVDSNFWNLPHKEDDVELGTDDEFSTPAVDALMDALNMRAEELNTDLHFILTVTDEEEYTLGPNDEYGGYPNNWMMRGQYRGPHKDKHVIWLELRPLSEDFNIDDVDISKLAKKISLTINHELVHYNQLKKQAQSKGISEEDAWEEMLADPRQFSKSGKYSDYITRHIEVDAFAHEAAEQLLDKYSPDEALSIIRKKNGTTDGIVGDYIATIGGNSAEIRKFWTKLYTQIQQQSQELSEDSDFQKNMKKNLPKELDFLLNKGKNNKKEGEGVTNPPNPKFDSKPPGASGG